MSNMVFEIAGFIGHCTDADYLRDLALSIGDRIAALKGRSSPTRTSADFGQSAAEAVAPMMAELKTAPGVGCQFDAEKLAETIAAKVVEELKKPFTRPAERLEFQPVVKPLGDVTPPADPPADPPTDEQPKGE